MSCPLLALRWTMGTYSFFFFVSSHLPNLNIWRQKYKKRRPQDVLSPPARYPSAMEIGTPKDSSKRLSKYHPEVFLFFFFLWLVLSLETRRCECYLLVLCASVSSHWAVCGCQSSSFMSLNHLCMDVSKTHLLEKEKYLPGIFIAIRNNEIQLNSSNSPVEMVMCIFRYSNLLQIDKG